MKKYKKYQLLFFLNFIIIITFLIFLIGTSLTYYNEYTKLTSIYIMDNIIEVVVNNKQLKQLEKNNYIYLNSKKKKIYLVSITKNIYKRNNQYYHQVLLKVIGITDKTVLNISIFNKKNKLVNLFKECWKEE